MCIAKAKRAAFWIVVGCLQHEKTCNIINMVLQDMNLQLLKHTHCVINLTGGMQYNKMYALSMSTTKRYYSEILRFSHDMQVCTQFSEATRCDFEFAVLNWKGLRHEVMNASSGLQEKKKSFNVGQIGASTEASMHVVIGAVSFESDGFNLPYSFTAQLVQKKYFLSHNWNALFREDKAYKIREHK